MERRPPDPAVIRSLSMGITNALAAGIANSFRQLPSVVRSMGQALAANGTLPNQLLRETNLHIATMAQEAVVGGLRATLPEGSGPYRAGQRLTGTLEPALASASMLAGTDAHNISFVNEDVLNREARHWYRINYGVAGNTSQGPSREARAYTVTLNGNTLMTLRDDRPPARGGAYLPRRFLFDGIEMFVLRGPAKPPRAGVGARAAHFIDLGFESVARNVDTYEAVFRRWVDGPGVRDRLAARKIQVIVDLRLEPQGRYGVTVH